MRTRLANSGVAHRSVLRTKPPLLAYSPYSCRGILSGRSVSVPRIVHDHRPTVSTRLIAYRVTSGGRGALFGAARCVTAPDQGRIWSSTKDIHHSQCGPSWFIIFCILVDFRGLEESSKLKLNTKHDKNVGSEYLVLPVVEIRQERNVVEDGDTLACQSLPLRAHHSMSFWGTGA